MKDSLKPRAILFYLLSTLVFFVLGMAFAGVTGAGKNQGLAGGAIVFGYGVITALIALVGAIASFRFLTERVVVLLNKIFAFILVLAIAFVVYRVQSGNTDVAARPELVPLAVTKPLSPDDEGQKAGVGMAMPRFFDHPVMYFYGNPNLEKPIADHTPTDSLVFVRSEFGFEIAAAPPWFVPAHLKLDYDILLLRVLSLHSDFIEVVVNELNGQTAFMDRNTSTVRCWPEFLLSINSIEAVNSQDNPVRVKPLTHASPLSTEFSFLVPIRVADQWVEVKLVDDDLRLQGRGWVRWRRDGELLITYSLLS